METETNCNTTDSPLPSADERRTPISHSDAIRNELSNDSKDRITVLDSDDSNDCDESASAHSGTTANSRGKSPIVRRPGRKPKRGRQSKSAKQLYKFNAYAKLDVSPIFGCAFNHYLSKKQALLAAVGNNRLTIFDFPLDSQGGIQLVQCYADPDPDENFYTCAWSYDPENSDPIVAAAGYRGVIRIFNILKHLSTKHYIGHGHAINELKFHPTLPQILLSGSKDHSLRLWNIQTDVCVAIFGGVEGHRDEVLSVDFDLLGRRIISSGMDHSLKMWRLDKPEIKKAIEQSCVFSIGKPSLSFPTVKEHFPDYSTRDIHRNYVDCVQWFGEFLLSKSYENSIVCWKPGALEDTEVKPNDSTATIIHQFLYKGCDIWFIRFSFNAMQKVLALGNQQGKTYVWDLDATDPHLSKTCMLSHPKCVTTIRQTAFSKDGKILVCACDDGSLWRWDRNT